MKEKTAVVLVHGFTGGSDTWTNASGTSFTTLLRSDHELAQDYLFYTFDYYSKVVSLFDSALFQKILSKIPFSGLIPGISGRVKSNRPIKKLSEELATFLDLNLEGIDDVILIGHSMGGLVIKEHILSHEAGHGPNPTGYISLAVPHKGALGAALLGAINVNAAELTPLSEYSDELNNRWNELKNKLPPSIYVIAQHDELVLPTSAVPFPMSMKNKAIVPHDHTSICKPASSSDLAYVAVKKFLKNQAYQKNMKELAETSTTLSPPAYEKEIFVLKMMVCDIGRKGIVDAKECFFNAEIIAKSANRFDLAELLALQKKVYSIYLQKYNECVGQGMYANDVFAKVHAEITAQDEKVLQTSVTYLNFLHKKGLLHQLANNMKDDVIWSDDTDFDRIATEVK